MIEKIQIVDYRSCIDTSFELQPSLSVLIGPNGSGKTTILNSFLLLRQLVLETRRRHDEESATDECSIKVWFSIGGKRVIFNSTISLFTEADNSDIIVNSEDLWYAKDFTGDGKRIKFPLRFASQFAGARRAHFLFVDDGNWSAGHGGLPGAFQKPLIAISSFLSEMKYYSASQFTNPAECPVSFEVERTGRFTRSIGMERGHTRFLSDLYRAFVARDSSGYDEFVSVIGPGGIGLVTDIGFQEIIASSVDFRVRSGGTVKELKREKTLIVPQFTIGKNVLSPSQLSEGTFKTITLLFYVMTEKSSVLLIEEPEVCVHHGLLSSIVELIKEYSKQKQIVVSTHSDYVLDKLEPKSVYAVSRDLEKGTAIRNIAASMTSRELAALKDYLDHEGNLGEYWRHGGLE